MGHGSNDGQRRGQCFHIAGCRGQSRSLEFAAFTQAPTGFNFSDELIEQVHDCLTLSPVKQMLKVGSVVVVQVPAAGEL